MSFFKALVSSLTDSKSEKVSKHVQELASETLVAIRAIETEFPSEAHKLAAACRQLVISLPRGSEGYNKSYNLYYDHKEKRSSLHAAAWLASRLILADHVVERAGGDGLSAIVGIPLIQGYIEAFFQRHEVPAWNAPYHENRFFDAHRESSESVQAEGAVHKASAADVTGVIKAAKAATMAQKTMNAALAEVSRDAASGSEEAAFAATSFLAGLAIEFGVQQGIPNPDLPIVVEAALSKTMGEDLAGWYASNLGRLLEENPSRLAINAGRSAALLADEDDTTPAVLLGAVIKKATGVEG